jgi:hypothetical protein
MVGAIFANPEKFHAKAKLFGILFVFVLYFLPGFISTSVTSDSWISVELYLEHPVLLTQEPSKVKRLG